MTTKRLIVGVAASALLSITACNRDTAATSEGAASADSAAIDAVASTSKGDTSTPPISSAPSRRTSSTPAASTNVGASETMTAGGDRTVVSGAPITESATTQEQIEITRDTLSPAGASSGPTAPRPQN